MSFLEEILVSKGLSEVQELNDKIQEISKSMMSLKEEVVVAMEDNYINYTCALDDTAHSMRKLKNIATQVNEVQDRIDGQMKIELNASKHYLETLSDALIEATLSFELVSQLLKVHTALDAAQSEDTVKILDTAQQLKTAEDELKKDSSGLECLEIFESLKAELIFQQSKYSYNTVKLWSQSVIWSKSVVENNVKTVTLTLSTKYDKEELFKALHYYDMLSSEVSEFSERLINDLLYPIILKVTLVDCDGSNNLTVKIDSRSKQPSCMDVLNNLTIVFNFLYLHLNLNFDNNFSFISECKKKISDDFCRFFIQNCLLLSVPKKRDQLESYKALIEEITAFEVLLKEIGFLDEEDKSLSEYTSNVEELFAAKLCEGYLVAARKIMKKDLHDIKQVGPVETDTPASLEVTTQLIELSPYTFQFPSCQISKSTDELIELVHEILAEIPHNTDMCAVKLFYTARNILLMYCDVVPEFHNRLLETIPQQSAILHNNAMYLAHQMMFLGPKSWSSLPASLHSHTTTFIDLVDTLRKLAAGTLTRQLHLMKKNIIDFLRDSGLVTLSESPKFPDGIEKAIRQCLRQLSLLQTVWQHVLPTNTYCKALGLLCNVFVEEIIQRVVAAEDIPADTASQLVVVFALIQQKAPLVFPDPQEIHRNVKKWAKLGELVLLLGGGLKEVDDRWADGKGPLAQEFTADQVRHLVRALFQISDRRAILLAKIV